MALDARPSLFGTYTDRSADLTRYEDHPLDDAIGAIVREAAAGDLDAWIGVQERLTDVDCYTLFAFANRRAALSLRTGRSDFANEGIQALALIAAERVDPRDLTVDFPVYALRHTDGDVAASLSFAMAGSQPALRDYFKSRAKANLSLQNCGLIEVRSRHGLGFMETWAGPIPRDPSLPVAAVRVADRIDNRGRYETTALRTSSLPWVWFDRSNEPSRRGRDILTAGCVSISAQLRGASTWSHELLVFMSDMLDAASARATADMARGASDEQSPRMAISNGAHLLTVIGGSGTAGEVARETQASLAAIANDLAEAAWGLTLPSNADTD
jgi:hypothetical protein